MKPTPRSTSDSKKLPHSLQLILLAGFTALLHLNLLLLVHAAARQPGAGDQIETLLSLHPQRDVGQVEGHSENDVCPSVQHFNRAVRRRRNVLRLHALERLGFVECARAVLEGSFLHDHGL